MCYCILILHINAVSKLLCPMWQNLIFMCFCVLYFVLYAFIFMAYICYVLKSSPCIHTREWYYLMYQKYGSYDWNCHGRLFGVNSIKCLTLKTVIKTVIPLQHKHSWNIVVSIRYDVKAKPPSCRDWFLSFCDKKSSGPFLCLVLLFLQSI